jgi:hypothetical protein
MTDTIKPSSSSITLISWILLAYVTLATPLFLFAAFAFGLRFTELAPVYFLLLLPEFLLGLMIRDARKYVDQPRSYPVRVALAVGVPTLLSLALVHYFGTRLRLIPPEYSKDSLRALVATPVIASLTAIYVARNRISGGEGR